MSAPRPFRGLLRLLRPREWIKNAFVLAPLLFARRFLDLQSVADSLLATGVFCLASSAVYVLNDLCDVDADRLHSSKRLSRPLANGSVSPRRARALLATLLVMTFLPLRWISEALVPVVFYLALNAAYSLKLKQFVLLDLLCVAAGFVLRVQAGAAVLRVPLSLWMLVTTLCLALFMASLKRRRELELQPTSSRVVLRRYGAVALNRYAGISAVSTVVSYGLFAVTRQPALAWSLPLVIYGLFRYRRLVDEPGAGESPADVVIGDPSLILTITGWALLAMYSLWPE